MTPTLFGQHKKERFHASIFVFLAGTRIVGLDESQLKPDFDRRYERVRH